MGWRWFWVVVVFCALTPLLAPQVASVAAVQKLVTDPGGVEVLVDGIAMGSTDLQSGVLVLRGLSFGERNFTLRRRGYEPIRSDLPFSMTTSARVRSSSP